ncbi:MAG: AMP-binding enzyme, partial [Stellaceae bacterium]
EASFNRHGWFMSGDLGRLDAKGCLEILGRKKDLIIRGGHNIYPASIEDLALRHPAVARVAAFPVADARLGERACIAVVMQPDARLDPMALVAHLRAEGLSIYDLPEFFAEIEAFPLTASGKVLKRELVLWAKAGRIALQPIEWREGRRGAS